MNLLTPGERVEDLIKEKGGSITGDAEKIGTSQCTLSDFINGKRSIRSDTLKKLCEYYNVSSDYILGLSDVPTRNETIQEINAKTGLSQEAITALIVDKTCEDTALIDFISFLISKKERASLLIKAVLQTNKFNSTQQIGCLDIDGNDVELEMEALYKTYAEKLFWEIVSQYKDTKEGE